MGPFTRSRRKLVTPILLALWLFALTASMVHACGLDEAFGQEPNGVIAGASLESEPDGLSPACAEFCVDNSAVLAKLKVIEDSPVGSPLPTAFPVPLAPVSRLARGFDRASPLAISPPAIAINTRFVRLAL